MNELCQVADHSVGLWLALNLYCHSLLCYHCTDQAATEIGIVGAAVVAVGDDIRAL